MATAYAFSAVRQVDPRAEALVYTWTLPSGYTAVSQHIYSPPMDANGFLGCQVAASSAPSAADTFLLSIEGTLDSPSIGATSRSWFTCRGDASAANVLLSAVTMGFVDVLSEALAYRMRVCGPTACSSAITITAMVSVG